MAASARPQNLDLAIRFFDNYSRTLDALRQSFANIEEKYKEYDKIVNFGVGYVEDIHLNHGFSEGTTNYGIYDIKDIVYNSNLQEYLTVNKYDEIKRFSWTGRPLPDPPRRPSKRFERFIHIYHTSTYVCWTPFKKGFFVAKEDFSIAVDTMALAPIRDIIYGDRKGEEFVEFFVLADVTVTRYSYNPTSNIVSMQDVLNLSDMEASGGVIEATCFDNPDDDRKQWIYLTYQEHCCVIDISGRFHGSKKKLHPNKVTAVMASNNSDFVVTGDAKGFLKLWGSRRWIFLAEIRPHNCAVSHLIRHPTGRASISFARDQVIFSWSFDNLCKLDRVKSSEIVSRISINKHRPCFMAQGPRKLVIWRMDILYQFHAPITAPMRRVELSWNPRYAGRAVAICDDNSIRIINPPTGAILTSVLGDPTNPIRQAVYLKNEEMNTMIVLAQNQEEKLELQLWDCSTNPSQLKVMYDESTWDTAVTAVSVYDYCQDYQLAEKQMGFSAIKQERFSGKATFLIAGRRDGYIAKLDFTTGELQFASKCHKSPVTRIEVNNELAQFASLGIDPSIRVWKITLSTDEPFVPLFDISWKYPIRLIAWIRQYLCFALSNIKSANHRTVVYNTAKTQRHDNNKVDRHEKEIISLSSCGELVLFCSAALDETVRIWNHENALLRILTLNWVPTCAGFVSRQGDLFVGIDNSIQILPAEKYLTVIYRNRAKMANFGPGQIEPAIVMEVARAGDDPRLLAIIENKREVEVVAAVKEFKEPLDSQQTRDKEILREQEMDIRRIVEGNHPRDKDEPDIENMSKKQWDEYAKATAAGDEEAADKKFFISRGRKDCMIKMKALKKELDDFSNIL